MPPVTATDPAAPAADSTLIGSTPTTPTGGTSSTEVGGVPKATPEGSTPPAATPAPAAAPPAGSSQVPTPAPDASKPADDPSNAPKPPAAPEHYGEFNVPEGVVLDPTITTEFKTVAKELNLSQDQAQKLVDLQSKVADKVTKDTTAQFDAMKNEWRAETLKSLGPNADQQLAFAAKARDTFLSPKSIEVLNQSGLGNYPSLVLDLIKIGKAISEDSFTEGKLRAAGDKTAAEILYPNLKK